MPLGEEHRVGSGIGGESLRAGSNLGEPDDRQPCTRETERCEFWTWQKDYLRPPCCTSHLKTLLAFTEDLLARNRIRHFLDYGSLLGAVRSQSLIPWDEDGDFSCLSTDLARVVALGSVIQAAGFWLDKSEQPNVLRICVSQVNRIHVDLWFHRIENGIAKANFVLDKDKWYFPAHFFDTLCEVTLHDKLYPAPAPVEAFLSMYRYGPDFMTPRRISGSWCWIPRQPLTPAVELALEDLRELEYREWCLQALLCQREQTSWTYRLTRRVPGWVLQAHRALWKIRRRLSGRIPDATPELLDVLYEIQRRDLAIGLLTARAKETAT
jgi:hypothetical protein